MNNLTFWRAATAVATLGWALTAVGWWTAADPARVDPSRTTREEVVSESEVAHRSARQPRRVVPATSAAKSGTDPSERARVREEVRSEVVAEFERERADRRQQRGERHLSRLVDDIAEFVELHDLGDDVQAGLESAMVTMHDELEELRPSGPPGPDGPPPEVMEALETAFDAFQDSVAEQVSDPELADEFVERMTPRPLRDAGRRRDRG